MTEDELAEMLRDNPNLKVSDGNITGAKKEHAGLRKKNYKKQRSHGEHEEQVKFFDWVRINRKGAPNQNVREVMELCYSVPNGASLKKVQDKNGNWWSPVGKRLKLEGMTRGVLDINLDWPIVLEGGVFCYASLRIEMKFGTNNLSLEQIRQKELLEKAGFKVAVCYSAKEAIQAVFDYLHFDEKDYQGIREFLI